MTKEQQHLSTKEILKSHVNRYAFVGLLIAMSSIVIASCIVCYQMTGHISFQGIYLAQLSNPAIWALDLSPLFFAYWGQSFLLTVSNEAANILASKEQELQSKSEDLELKYQYESNHDSLTQLPNRQLLCEKIKQNILHSTNKKPMALIIVKFKNFEKLKMTISIYNLNNILRQFAEKLKAILLEPVLAEQYLGMNMVAHLQNDQFAIMLPGLSSEKALEDILHTIISLSSTDYLVGGIMIHIDAIAGAASYPHDSGKAAELLHQADISISIAQKEERPYVVYDPVMAQEYTHHRSILEAAKKAIATDNFQLIYQPYFHLNTRKIIGAEVSITIESIAHGKLTADKIWPHISNTNLGRELSRLMLKKAIAQLSTWHEMGYPINLSLPLSAQEIMDPAIPKYIQSLADSHQIHTEYLEVSFTEEACLNDQNQSLQVLNALAEMDISLSIEDFCSGYSSFVYLNHFPISKLKIDKTFIQSMLDNDQNLMLVTAMIQIAKTLKLQIQAMGIENKAVLDKLSQLGCHFGQGLTSPLPAKEFESMFNTELLCTQEYKKAQVS